MAQAWIEEKRGDACEGRQEEGEEDTGWSGFQRAWGGLGWAATFSSSFRCTRKKVGRGGDKSWGCCYRARIGLKHFRFSERRIASACGQVLLRWTVCARA